jgi:hypothetical protein
MMRHALYKKIHRENLSWYPGPLMEGELADNCIEGQDAELVACDKAWELNKKAGRLALAAKGDSSGER